MQSNQSGTQVIFGVSGYQAYKKSPPMAAGNGRTGEWHDPVVLKN